MHKNIKEMTLKLGEISCTGCAQDMEKILLETEGILDASADYKNDVIHIKYDPALIDREKAYMAIKKLGGVCKIISEHGLAQICLVF
ncbi:MAG: heavy-metal-associated domain-containing protein [Nitrospirae bacterium]|nr:heavy-metal-associated domain-containing protein [Nitrospirota bacterium]